MKWRKLSNTTRILILAFAIIFLCGLPPLLLFDDSTVESEELLKISHLVDKLENEHKELTTLISSLEKDTKRSELNHSSSLPLNSMESMTADVLPANDRTVKPADNSPIFPRPITFNTPSSLSAKSVLVVGGTGEWTYSSAILWKFAALLYYHRTYHFRMTLSLQCTKNLKV